jgi:hypothetical protein
MLFIKKSRILAAVFSLILINLLNASNEPVIVAQPRNVAQCIGGTEVLKITVKEGIKATFQWQQSLDNTQWMDIKDANRAELAPNSTDLGIMWYRAVVTIEGDIEHPITSEAASVTVAEMPTINMGVVGTGTICQGENVTLKATISGGVNCTVLWQKSTDGKEWIDVDDQTGDTLTYKMTEAKAFRAKSICMGSGCCK